MQRNPRLIISLSAMLSRRDLGFVASVSPLWIPGGQSFAPDVCHIANPRRRCSLASNRRSHFSSFPSCRSSVRCELTQNETGKETTDRMRKTIESVQNAFNTVRTGRASTSILDRVMVTYYGTETPLNQLASISLSGTSTILVEPYDKSCMGDVERGLQESDVGITPSNDGSCIRLTVPPLSEERRKELVKQVKGLAEEGRVALRNIRRDAVDSVKKLEKKKELGEDESKTLQDEVQKITDKHVKLIDELLKKKETDIMKV